MSLVTCPDCARKVSDQAPSCPQCGRPFGTNRMVAPPTEGLFLRTLNVGCATVLAVFALLLLLMAWAPRK